MNIPNQPFSVTKFLMANYTEYGYSPKEYRRARQWLRTNGFVFDEKKKVWSSRNSVPQCGNTGSVSESGM